MATVILFVVVVVARWWGGAWALGRNILKHECVIVRGFTPPRGNNSRRRQNR